tara:strand:+ start:442 stop:756 length:315 start_codon:yes stop_codon:yes gene_type:complete
MEKPKIIGLGNKEGRSFYILEKDISFFPFFSRFLMNCRINDPTFTGFENEILDINDWTDRLYNFKNLDYDIDLFFGKNSIIITIRAENDKLSGIKKGIKQMCRI